MPSASHKVIRPRTGLARLRWTTLITHRELLLFLVWRDIVIRYKQTVIGIAWAVLQPLMMMGVFTLVFSYFARLPSKGVPYPLLAMAALLPWGFFANATQQGSASLITSRQLVTKVYFPRILLPASVTLSGSIDFLLSGLLFLVLMVWYQIKITALIVFLPFFFFLALVASFGFSLWFSALNVKFRDIKYAVPFVLRLGMLFSPVGYTSDVVPGTWQWVYGLNPMVGVIEGFRWCLLGEAFTPSMASLLAGTIVAFGVLFSGGFYFATTERNFADVI